MQIEHANPSDAEAILDLQKRAYASEAEIYNDYNITPLTQTLEEIRNEIEQQQIFLKAISVVVMAMIISQKLSAPLELTPKTKQLLFEDSWLNQNYKIKELELHL